MLTLNRSDCDSSDGFDDAIETVALRNITGLTNPSNQSFTYGYDGLDRLTTSDQTGTPAVEYSFTYDSTGNRISKKVGTAAVQNYTYPTTNHRLTNVAGTARTLDLNGNTTQATSSKRWTYDQRNRMVDFRTSATAINTQYQYNAKGERVRKYLNTADKARYVFNEAGQLLSEETISGTVTTTTDIVWLDGIPVGAVRNGTLYEIEADHLGTPRNIYDFTTKTKIWSWPLGADAFGETQPNQDPDANGQAFVFNLRFPGQLYDSESGLNYNYFRDYDAATGRYSQSDPIGLRGGASTYNYVFANPFGNTDELGLFGGFGSVYRQGFGEAQRRLSQANYYVNQYRNKEFQIGFTSTAFGGAKGGSITLLAVAISDEGIFYTPQACAGAGAGKYVGGGVNFGIAEKPDCDEKEGFSTSAQWSVEAGDGFVGGVSGPVDLNGLSISAGNKTRLGGGVGWYGAIMGCMNYRIRMPNILDYLK